MASIERPSKRETAQSQSYPIVVSIEEAIELHKDPQILGNKGLNLILMAGLGLPIPPAVIVTTEAWKDFKNKGKVSPQLWEMIEDKVADLQIDPFFVSVRSGAPISMPGAMETILNIGINDDTVLALGEQIGETAALEAYFELIASFGSSVFNINEDLFAILRGNVESLNKLPVNALKRLVANAKQVIESSGFSFPQDPHKQLRLAVNSVLASWNKEDARNFRKQYNIPANLGTAVVIQKMIFGNSLTEGAGTGVLFTENTKTGEPTPIVAYKQHAQGPSVVGDKEHAHAVIQELELPASLKRKLKEIVETIKNSPYFVFPQEVEFTSDGDNIYALQTRNAPLSKVALFRLAQRLIKQGLSEFDLKKSINIGQLEALLKPDLDENAVKEAVKQGRLIASGLSISLGIESGILAKSIKQARELEGKKVVLSTQLSISEISNLPDNVVAVLIENGGIGSHLARRAEQIGDKKEIPIIIGTRIRKDKRVPNGALVTVDGNKGRVFKGSIPFYKNGGTSLLNTKELSIVKKWYEEKIKNPWLYVIDSYEEFEEIKRKVGDLAEDIKRSYSSHKAYEIALTNLLIPEEIRMDYKLLQPSQVKEMKSLIKKILESGNDTTIRTCHNPTLPAGGPWAAITKVKDIGRLFEDPDYSKYGNYENMIRNIDNHVVTEIVVGSIPKDKLNPNQEIQKQHCAWTLTCTKEGQIILQFSSNTSQLRSHESANPEKIATFIIEPPYIWDGKLNIQTKIGAKLRKREETQAFSQILTEVVLGTWLNEYKIPYLMASLAEAFPFPDYGTPVLEGQARFNPGKPENNWCLVYGVKIDKLED